jgi:RNA polymerase sigma-70 factor (ECF subfamily)
MWLLSVALAYNDDSDLIRRLQARDPDALEQLYDRYSPMTFGIIRRIAGDTAAAEDLLQEVFLKIWERAQSFERDKGSLGTWLIALARNRAIDYRRSVEGRMNKQSVGLESMPSSSGPARVEEEFVLRLDRVAKVKAALQTLSDSQRRVIELAYYDGMSQTEIAAKLGQPLGTVKALMRRGLQVIKDSL